MAEDYNPFLAYIAEKKRKPDPMRATGEFLSGAAQGFGGGLLEAVRGTARAMSAGTSPLAAASLGGETVAGAAAATAPQPTSGIRTLGPGQAPPTTVAEAENLGRSPMWYELANQAMLGIPGIVERGVHGTFGSQVQLEPQGTDPNSPVTATPVDVPPSERGRALGEMGGLLTPYAVGGKAAGLINRFEPRPTALPDGMATGPESPAAPQGGYDVYFTKDGPVIVPRGSAGPPTANFEQGPTMLPEGRPGIGPSGVQEGFTPIRSKYQVWVGTKRSAPAPGSKAPKPEFNQFKEVEALSQDDAIRQVRDAMNRDTPGRAEAFDFRADVVKGSQKPVPPAEARGMAAGKPTTPVSARQREAMLKKSAAAEGEGPTAKKPIELGVGEAEAARQRAEARQRGAMVKKATAAEGVPPSGKTFSLGTGRPADFQEGAAPPEAAPTPKEVKPAPPGFKPLGDNFVVRVKPKGETDFTAEMQFKAVAEAGALKAARNKLGRNADKYDYEIERIEPDDGGEGGGGVPARRAPKGPKTAPATQTPKPLAPLRPAESKAAPSRAPSPAEAIGAVERGIRRNLAEPKGVEAGDTATPARGTPQFDMAVRRALQGTHGARERLAAVAGKSDAEIIAFLDRELGYGGGGGGPGEPWVSHKGGKNPFVRIGSMHASGKVEPGAIEIKGKALAAEVRRLYGAAPSERVGGKSKVVREPTAEEAQTMAPGETRTTGSGDVVVRMGPEVERRIASRRGTGGGATSFGEERGPEAPERRAPSRGRRAEDRAAVQEAGKEGERRLAELDKARTLREVRALWEKYNPGRPAPKKAFMYVLRRELRNEAEAMVQGAKQALEVEKPPAAEFEKTFRPKGKAAAEAAPLNTGRASTVKTPSKDFEVDYVEVPISSLKPSNNPISFEPNPDYPFEQQRDYRTNKIEQMKVIEMAKRFDPEFFFADTPTATDGVPIVSKEGYVLGGNARTMALMRGLKEGTIDPATLQAYLMMNGNRFGFPGAGSKRGTIIVRRLRTQGDVAELAKDTKALNEDFKMAVDPISDAVARARNLSGETVDWLAEVLSDLGPDATVRAAIFDDPARLAALMGRLAEDQVVVSSELPRLLDPATNKLTPEGQRLIESAIVGRVIKSPKMIREMSPSLKNVVMGAMSELTRGESFPSEWRVNNDVVNGLWLYHLADKANKSIDMMLEPQLYPEPFLDAIRDNRVAIAMAKWFEANRSKSTALRTALKTFNARASEATSTQEMLSFAKVEDLPHDAFNVAFGTKLTAADFGTGDGVVYLHAGLSPESLAPLWAKVGEKARQLRDWVFIPKDVREPHVPGESFTEWWERGMYPRTGDAARRWIAQTWQSFAKVFIANYETRRFPYFHEQLDQFKIGAMEAWAKETDRAASVVHPLVYRQDPVTGVFKRRPGPEMAAAIQQFQLILGVSDMWARSKTGALTPASGFPGFSKFKPAELTAALEAETKTLLATSSPAVRLAHKNWIEWMTDLRQEMVKRGKLTANDRLGWAYAPNVINDLSWQQMWSVATGPIHVREAVRPYVKRFVGHLRKHDPNMLRAGLHHAANVRLDNLLDDFAHSVGQAWDHYPQVWKEIEARAKKSGRTVEEEAKATGLPSEMAVYRVGGSRHLWNPSTMTEYVVDKVLQEELLSFENIWQIKEYAGTPEGKARPAYVVPSPIAESLNQFREARGPLDRLAAQFSRGISYWKGVTLMSIYVPYAMRNAWGDFSNLARRLPGTGPFPGLMPLVRYGPKAAMEIIKASAPKQTVSALLRQADAVGVRQNTRAVAEMADLRAHVDLRPFFRPHRGRLLAPAQRVLEAANDMLAGMMVVDSIREGTLRLAAWEYLVDQGFPHKRAERVVSEIVGDYRNTDRFTGIARRNGVAPFAVWIRQMIPGWFRWMTGAKLGRYFEVPELAERTPAAVARASKIAKARGITIDEAFEAMGREAAIPPPNVKRPPVDPPPGVDPKIWENVHSGRFTKRTWLTLTLGIGVPTVMTWYWNNVMHKELNDKIDKSFRERYSYLVLPWWQTNDGRPLIWAVQDPLDAVISFVGLQNPVDRAKRFAEAWSEGPAAVSKMAWDQVGESVASVGAGISDLTGPPVKILQSFGELGAEVAKERGMDPEKQKGFWELLRRKYNTLYRDVIPGAGALRSGALSMQRRDLEGLPSWAVGGLAQYPWGGLFYVPLSEEEKEARRARRTSQQTTTLRPAFRGQDSALRAMPTR